MRHNEKNATDPSATPPDETPKKPTFRVSSVEFTRGVTGDMREATAAEIAVDLELALNKLENAGYHASSPRKVPSGYIIIGHLPDDPKEPQEIATPFGVFRIPMPDGTKKEEEPKKDLLSLHTRQVIDTALKLLVQSKGVRPDLLSKTLMEDLRRPVFEATRGLDVNQRQAMIQELDLEAKTNHTDCPPECAGRLLAIISDLMRAEVRAHIQ